MNDHGNQYHRTTGTLNIKSSYASVEHYNGGGATERTPMLQVVKENEPLKSSVGSMVAMEKDDNNDNNRQKGCCSVSYWVWALVAFFLVSLLSFGNKSRDVTPSAYVSGKTLRSASNNIAKIPFPFVDRSEFGSNPQPASSIVNPDLFDSSLLGEGKNLLKVPFPTGAFWTNLVITPTADREFSYPIMAYPYAYKWNPTMLQISLPSLYRMMDEVSLRHIFIADLTLSVADAVSKRHVSYFDPMSVTLRYESSNKTDYWESYIVQGSPYVTSNYQNMIPSIHALSTFRGISCSGTGSGSCEEMSSDSKVRPDILRESMDKKCDSASTASFVFHDADYPTKGNSICS